MLVNYKVGALLLLLCLAGSSQAQPLKYQSVFLYQFASQIEWPLEQRREEISIGVVGNAEVAKELEAFFAGKRIYTRQVTVRHFPSPEQTKYCHILFVPAGNGNSLPQVLRRVEGWATLVVTDKAGSSRLGSSINFLVSADGQFRFELNQAAARKHRLKIPNTIVSMAILI